MIYKLSLYTTIVCSSRSGNDALSFNNSHLTPSSDFHTSLSMPVPCPPTKIISPLNDTALNPDLPSNGAFLCTLSHYNPSSDFHTSLFLVPLASSPAITYIYPLCTKLACLNLGENAELEVSCVHSFPSVDFHTSFNTDSPFPPMT